MPRASANSKPKPSPSHASSRLPPPLRVLMASSVFSISSCSRVCVRLIKRFQPVASAPLDGFTVNADRSGIPCPASRSAPRISVSTASRPCSFRSTNAPNARPNRPINTAPGSMGLINIVDGCSVLDNVNSTSPLPATGITRSTCTLFWITSVSDVLVCLLFQLAGITISCVLSRFASTSVCPSASKTRQVSNCCWYPASLTRRRTADNSPLASNGSMLEDKFSASISTRTIACSRCSFADDVATHHRPAP